MSVLGKIRNQSALLITLIGVAMLLFIVGGDFLRNIGGTRGDDTVAEINGNVVNYKEFETRIQYEIDQQFQGQPIDEQTKEQVRKRIWSKYLNEYVMFKEYDILGLGVSKEELMSQVKSSNPSPILSQYFTDPKTGQPHPQLLDPTTGQLDPNKIVLAVKGWMENNPGLWVQIEQAIKLDRFQTKYNNLVKKGLYTTTKESEIDYFEKNTKYTVEYATKDFTSIKDEEVSFTDSDLEKYYNEHKHESFYQSDDETRKIEYVVFNVEATTEDKKAIKEDVEVLVAEFESAEKDTLFTVQNADNPKIQYESKGSMAFEVDSLIQNSEVGKVFGPYEDAGFFKLSKVIGNKQAPDSVKARHILVKIVGNDTTSAQTLVDSLKKVIKKGGDFAKLAEEFSEDFGSAQEGGDLGWFTEGTMVPAFNDACFAGKVGDMPVVTSRFGIHLIEVLEQTELKKKVLVATIDRKIEPSVETLDKAYNEASAFAINNSNAESFRAAANEKGIRIADRIKQSDKTVQGLGNTRELVRWAYNNDIGAVSKEPFELENGFVIAHLTEIKSKGTLPLSAEVVKQRITSEVIREKKSEKIIADLSGVTSVQDAASKLGAKVETVDNITFGSFSVPGLGGERALIGTIAGVNGTSKAFSDKRGVYVVAVKSKQDAQSAPNYFANKMQLIRGNQSRVDYEAFNALQDQANIIDNRGKFY